MLMLQGTDYAVTQESRFKKDYELTKCDRRKRFKKLQQRFTKYLKYTVDFFYILVSFIFECIR